MNTVELLTGVDMLLRRNPGFIDEIDYNDISKMVYLDLQCRRQLFTTQQFERVESFFEGILSEILTAIKRKNHLSLEKSFEKLISYVEVLPDSEYVSDFIERANLDHLRLEHILKKTIYVVGDSHVNFFSGNEKLSFVPIGNGINTCRQVGELPVSVFHMGPCLAYNSNRYGTTSRFREKLDYLLGTIIEAGAEIMFVMGEIDIRVHVFKLCLEKSCSFEKNVEKIVENYMDMMMGVKAQGYRVYCFGPIASQSEAVSADEEFVKCGTEVERNLATAYFTQMLEKRCADEDIIFMSIFDKMVTDDWHTKSEFLCNDGCHLGQVASDMVRNEFTKVGISATSI